MKRAPPRGARFDELQQAVFQLSQAEPNLPQSALIEKATRQVFGRSVPKIKVITKNPGPIPDLSGGCDCQQEAKKSRGRRIKAGEVGGQSRAPTRMIYPPGYKPPAKPEPEAEPQQGEGIISDVLAPIATKIAGFIAPKTMPRNIKAFITKYGAWNINALQVCRVPIVSLINKVIKLIAGSKYTYDDLYHLYLLVTITDGKATKSFRIERNEKITVNEAITADFNRGNDQNGTTELPADGSQIKGPACIKVSTPTPKMTITQAFQNFEKEGSKRNTKLSVWRYAALPDKEKGIPSNNCQDFCSDFIKGLGTLTDPVQTFIKQPIEELVPSIVQRAAQTITDAAGGISQAIGGCADCEADQQGGETVLEPPRHRYEDYVVA